MSWKINKIEIENFKFFKNAFSINVDRKNILLYGENGAGKSSIYWSVYTHFQAYAKPQIEAQKYFTAGHAQNLRNRYAAPTDDSSIKIYFDNGNGMTKTVEDSNTCYYAADAEVLRFMKFTAMSSDFMNYKFLSSLFDFRNSQDNEVFLLFEKEVLPYIDLDRQLWRINGEITNTYNAGEWWGYITRVYHMNAIPRSNRSNAFDQRTPFYKNYQGLLQQFNELLHNKLSLLVTKANIIIKDVFHLESRLILQYEHATFNNRLASRKFDAELHRPKIYLKAVMVSDKLVDQSIIEHPRSFFNEAKITCMALALRLAILESHPSSLEAPSVLFIDDLLISLDMPFRRKIIEILLTYTDKFQTFIFTHDRAFYHLVSSEIKIKGCHNNWKKYELYMQPNNGIPEPFLIEPKTPLEKAKMLLRNLEIPASVNAARRAAEQELKRLLPTNLIFNEKSQTFQCDLNGLIERYYLFAKDIGLPNVIPHLQDERKLLLNPFSHDDINTPFYRNELDFTIQEIENLSRISKRIVVDAKYVYQKKYLFRIEKDEKAYDFTIIFKEMLYEYEYDGQKFYNWAKIEVKTSSIPEIECKEWGLKQLLKKACHYVFHNTNNLPKLMNCLRDKDTGNLL